MNARAFALRPDDPENVQFTQVRWQKADADIDGVDESPFITPILTSQIVAGTR
jgi:hypothetical protein